MLLLRLLLLMICSIINIQTIFPRTHHDRYDPHKKQSEPLSFSSQKSIHNQDEEESSEKKIEDDFQENEGEHLLSDEEGRGALGAICIDLADYCSYFANNLMIEAEEGNNKTALLLFSDVMHLMADLSDQEVMYIRAETYTSDLTNIAKTMKHLYEVDTSFSRSIFKHPLLEKLFNTHITRTPSSDADIELGIFLHNQLRSQETAEPLVAAIFSEMSNYAQTKIHLLLDMFHQDTRKLFDLYQHQTKSGPKDLYGRHMRQMSWLCHHAADACLDLASSFQASPLLSSTLPLMNQLQAMLSAMSLTYNNLSSGEAYSRAHDCHELATHFANMIHLLPETAPLQKTMRNSLESTYLDRCTALESPQEKQHFVERIFRTEFDRDALLSEFFPAIEKAFGHNLTSLSKALSEYTIETLGSHYWQKIIPN